MGRFCLVNALDGRREAPDSKRTVSAARCYRREASDPSVKVRRGGFRANKLNVKIQLLKKIKISNRYFHPSAPPFCYVKVTVFFNITKSEIRYEIKRINAFEIKDHLQNSCSQLG